MDKTAGILSYKIAMQSYFEETLLRLLFSPILLQHEDKKELIIFYSVVFRIEVEITR